MSHIFGKTKKVKEIYTLLQPKKLNKKSLSNCKIMSWNVWSMLSDQKCSHVLQVLADNEIQVACISETWFDSKNGKYTKSIKEAGYELIHDYREDKLS